MNVIQTFWLKLFEVIYMPIDSFFGTTNTVALIVISLFVALQVWTFWHFFFKPFIYVCKLFIDIIRRNLLFKEVEVDEKTDKRCD